MFPCTSVPAPERGVRSIALAPLLMLCVSGCGGQVADRGGETRPAVRETESLAQWLVGRWEIASADGGGPMLTIAVDSAQGRSFAGRLLHFISGDVGLDPARFKRLEGEVISELMAVTIDSLEGGQARIYLVFRRVGTELQVIEFALGQENMLANDRRWIARRVI